MTNQKPSGFGASGIVLAAGASRRLGRPKQLLPLAGRPLVRWAVAAALASRLDRVVVVTGHRGHEVTAALEPLAATGERLETVCNPHHPEGQGMSLAAGLAALKGRHCRAVMILLADQPFVGAGHIDALLGTDPVARGTIRVSRPPLGSWRPPVLLGRDYFHRLATLSGDRGARAIVASNPDRITQVPVAHPHQLMDIDTPEDYRQAEAISAKLGLRPAIG